MFNFFQKKKNNRIDGGRTKKEEVKKSSPVFSSKESNVSVISKKESAGFVQKTEKMPNGITPHVSEKSSNLLGKNFYVFKVENNFNKIIAKKAIEKNFGVKVDFVRILNTKSKPRRRGNIVGKKAGFKKAIIKLKEGYKIEF